MINFSTYKKYLGKHIITFTKNEIYAKTIISGMTIYYDNTGENIKFKTDADTETDIRINRDDLASMVGTAKESLVRMLKDFKDEQLITSNGRSIYILNHQGLLKASNSI